MIFVTGGTGLVGAHILYDLCQQNEPIRASKRMGSDITLIENIFHFYAPNNSKALLSKIEWVDVDLLDIDNLVDATKGIDTVYHAAAIVSFRKKDRGFMLDTNIKGTANLMNACLENEVKKVGYISSVAALGRTKEDQEIDENSHWEINKDNSNYSISKYGAEREVWRASEEGLNVVMVNPTIILGPGDWTRSSTTLFKNVYNGLKYYTNGSNGYVDVRDVSKCIIKLVNSDIKSERYVLVSDTVSYKQLFTKIATAYNKPAPRKEVGRFKAGLAWRLMKIASWFTAKSPAVTKETAHTALKNMRYSNAKIKSELDFKFRTVDESISDTALFTTQYYISKEH